MIYLIVPPIIIILAVAILIVFLARVLSSENNNTSVIKNEKKAKKKLKRSRKFFRKKSNKARRRIKKTFETTVSVLNEKKEKIENTGEIIRSRDVKNIVSLRKKSMISDKIDDGEERDAEEITLMKKIESDPQNSKQYECLGDYYMEQEKFEDARECYKYVLRLDPRHKRAQVAMKNLDRVLR